MEKLNKIIEKMAEDRFRDDRGRTPDSMMQFIMKNATLKEFVEHFYNAKDSQEYRIIEKYGKVLLGDIHGLAETFIHRVLWPKLKGKYIEDVVSELEHKVLNTITVRIVD